MSALSGCVVPVAVIQFANWRRQVIYPFVVVGSLSVYSMKRRKRSALIYANKGAGTIAPALYIEIMALFTHSRALVL